MGVKISRAVKVGIGTEADAAPGPLKLSRGRRERAMMGKGSDSGETRKTGRRSKVP
jgi:hypothetical protein